MQRSKGVHILVQPSLQAPELPLQCKAVLAMSVASTCLQTIAKNCVPPPYYTSWKVQEGKHKGICLEQGGQEVINLAILFFAAFTFSIFPSSSGMSCLALAKICGGENKAARGEFWDSSHQHRYLMGNMEAAATKAGQYAVCQCLGTYDTNP